MNCDQVFDVLTRGPFPTGDASDADVELHLAGCHECRQLAEALRPAVALFHEAIAIDQVGDLPGYHGRLPCASSPASPPPRESANRMTVVPWAVDAALRQISLVTPAERSVSPWRRWMTPGMWRVAAAVVLGVALGAILRMMDTPADAPSVAESPQTPITLNVAAGGRLKAAAPARRQLAMLGLPAACLGDDDEKNVSTDRAAAGHSAAAAIGANLVCCTECHTAGGEQSVPQVSLARLTSSCLICHQN